MSELKLSDEMHREILRSTHAPVSLQIENNLETERAAEVLEDFLARYNENEVKHDKSEKINFRIALITVTLSLLSLVATVIFGILALLN